MDFSKFQGDLKYQQKVRSAMFKLPGPSNSLGVSTATKL